MDRDDAHVVGRELDCPRLGEPHQAPLARRIVAQPVHTAQPRDRGVVDDHARLLPDHVRDHVAGDDPGALQVGVDHRVPLGLVELVGQAVGADPGVVEEDVDPPELAGRVVDRGGDRG